MAVLVTIVAFLTVHAAQPVIGCQPEPFFFSTLLTSEKRQIDDSSRLRIASMKGY